MAMLAEPRRKQKWSVDPRNSAWSKDESKFGQKMLERMGWSKGKGLGKSEQGATEHIKVKVKNNNLGLGTAANYEDNWIAHQDDFNQLLAELNNCHGQSDSTAEQKQSFSLEEKSKTSRKRVHYMKFTKGKDLSNRSETDLACIFGKRKKGTKDQEEVGSDQESQEEREKGEAEESAPDPPENTINTVTSTLTMQEYFAQRMAQLKGRQAPAATPETRTDALNGTAETCGHAPDTPTPGKSKSKKKKKKKDREEEVEVQAEVEDGTVSHRTEQHEAQEESSTGRKKKKRKHVDREMERDEGAVSCPAGQHGSPDQVPEDTQTHSDRKKKAKRCSEVETADPHTAAGEEAGDMDTGDKKRRKRKKREEGELLGEDEKKSKKDKKKKRKDD